MIVCIAMAYGLDMRCSISVNSRSLRLGLIFSAMRLHYMLEGNDIHEYSDPSPTLNSSMQFYDVFAMPKTPPKRADSPH